MDFPWPKQKYQVCNKIKVIIIYSEKEMFHKVRQLCRLLTSSDMSSRCNPWKTNRKTGIQWV